MPLVRIFTRLPEYPTELVRNLRSRGFEVETCVSSDTEHGSVNLEITLDQCSLDDLPSVISGTLPQKDLYILANPDAKEGKIRSIGMLMLVPNEGTERVQKTVVPTQIIEIYTALLRERQGGGRSIVAIYENWKEGSKVRRIAGNLGQEAQSTSKELVIFCGKKVGVLGKKSSGVLMDAMSYLQQLPAMFTGWYESRVFGLQGQTSQPALKVNDSRIDAELVPSMFNLSGDLMETVEMPEHSEQTDHVGNSSRVSNASSLRLWKGLALGAVAALLIMVFFQSFSQVPLSAKDNNPSAQTSDSVVPELPKNGTVRKIDDSVLPQPPALKTVHKLSADDSYFDQVVVRHFSQTKPTVPVKNGIKRRVVVD
jgi:hypothetical protein